MDVKELRIGNLVYFNNDIAEIKELFKDNPFYWESIKPIPLTEDWLLKFGAVKSDGNKALKKEFRFDGNYWYAIDSEYSYKLHNNTFYDSERFQIQEIKYIHQIQNLYFALTQEELVLSQ